MCGYHKKTFILACENFSEIDTQKYHLASIFTFSQVLWTILLASLTELYKISLYQAEGRFLC